MSTPVFLCVFCDNTFFFKKDFKEHIMKEHVKSGPEVAISDDLTAIVDHLSSYCSALEYSLSPNKSRRKRDKKYLPEGCVTELLVGCCFCDPIIRNYKLETFDRSDKVMKDNCTCGETDEDNGLHLVTCIQCHHSCHYECFEADEYSDEMAKDYRCKYCKEYSFVICTVNDLKPANQLKHYRQHLNYSPFKCTVDDCFQKFFTIALLQDHLEKYHQMNEQSIRSTKQTLLYSTERIVCIEELLENKGIIKEVLNCNYDECEPNGRRSESAEPTEEAEEDSGDDNVMQMKEEVEKSRYDSPQKDNTIDVRPSTSAAHQTTSVPVCTEPMDIDKDLTVGDDKKQSDKSQSVESQNVNDSELKKLKLELEESQKSLKNAIDQIKVGVLATYNEKINQINKNKQIQPDRKIPMRKFPFTDEITKCLKRVIVAKINILGDSEFKMNELIFNFCRELIAKNYWPKGWMTEAALAKELAKLSPKKSKPTKESNQNLTSSVTNTPKVPYIPLINIIPITLLNGTQKTAQKVNSQTPTAVIDIKQLQEKLKAQALQSSEPAPKKAKTDPTPQKSSMTANQNKTGNTKNLDFIRQAIIDQAIIKAGLPPPTPLFNSSSVKTEQSGSADNSRYNLRSKSDRFSQSSQNSPNASQSQSAGIDLSDQYTRWTTMTKLVKFPYFPQVGDRLVYLRSAHCYYLEKLKEKKLITNFRSPFKEHKYSLQDYQENDPIFVIIRDISFESSPFLSIKLKLEEECPNSLDSKPLEVFFYIQYIHLEEVPDFLILKSHYESSFQMGYSWKVGDPIRTAKLDPDHWVNGTIIGESTFEGVAKTFPTSIFRKYVVNLDIGNHSDRLSAWELEPKAETNETAITDEERQRFYNPTDHDWPNTRIDGRDIDDTNPNRTLECSSLEEAFEVLWNRPQMRQFHEWRHYLRATKPIYKIDLKTIRERIKNRFYRRLAQIEFDFIMIERNIVDLRKGSDNSLLVENIIDLRQVFMKFLSNKTYFERQKEQILELFNIHCSSDDSSIEELFSDDDLDVSAMTSQANTSQTNSGQANVSTQKLTQDTKETVSERTQPIGEDLPQRSVSTQSESQELISGDISKKCVVCSANIEHLDRKLAADHYYSHAMKALDCLKTLSQS